MTDLIFVDPTETEHPIAASTEWQAIIDDAISVLEPEDLPVKAIKVMEYLISGYPMTKAADAAEITTKTIRRWLVKYPELVEAIRRGQENLSRWRMSKLEQQFLDAVDFSADLLSGEANMSDPKVLGIRALQARYIIDLFTGKIKDLHLTQITNTTNVIPESIELKASQSALDYIASQAKIQTDDNVVDREFSIAVEKPKATAPLLDEDGEPFYGEYGVLDSNESGTLCHICGTRSSKLQAHIAAEHGLSPRAYENMYSLKPNEVKKSDSSNRTSG
jgi:hypothetical protein